MKNGWHRMTHGRTYKELGSMPNVPVNDLREPSTGFRVKQAVGYFKAFTDDAKPSQMFSGVGDRIADACHQAGIDNAAQPAIPEEREIAGENPFVGFLKSFGDGLKDIFKNAQNTHKGEAADLSPVEEGTVASAPKPVGMKAKLRSLCPGDFDEDVSVIKKGWSRLVHGKQVKTLGSEPNVPVNDLPEPSIGQVLGQAGKFIDASWKDAKDEKKSVPEDVVVEPEKVEPVIVVSEAKAHEEQAMLEKNAEIPAPENKADPESVSVNAALPETKTEKTVAPAVNAENKSDPEADSAASLKEKVMELTSQDRAGGSRVIEIPLPQPPLQKHSLTDGVINLGGKKHKHNHKHH